jgi:hypothetical protein
MQIAKGLPKDKRIVCVFTDSIRNYLTKFVNDDWLLESHLLSQEEYDAKYINKENINLFGGEEKVENVPKKRVKPVELTTRVEDCLRAFDEYQVDYVNNDKININNKFILN